MLRTNLSTRPFYNVRAVQVAILALTIAVVAFTAFNLVEIVRLATTQRTLTSRAREAEAQALQLRQEAVQLRGQIDPKALSVVADAAREANTIIDRRVFSWTDLFSQFEATLPADVRITQVEPRTDEDRLIIGVVVEARTVEDLDAFIEALEKTGAFSGVLPRQQQTTNDGLIEAVVEGFYTPQPREARAEASAPTAQSGATP
jgi:hypothetical protein